MNKKVTVFDFDKTLTDKDTLFGFYRSVADKDRFFYPKRFLLLIAGVFYKTGLINNSTLKRVGISLFLKGRSRKELETAAQIYAKQIKFNDIYFNYYQKAEGEKWIISASPEIYLRYLFPGENVAGTIFTFTEEKVKGLKINMFGREKKRFLNEKGVNTIDVFYTDSLSDKPLMDISDEAHIVERGELKVFGR